MKLVGATLCAILFALVPLKLASAAGWDTGNAGDAYVAEFILSGRDVLQRLELLPAAEREGINLATLRGALETEVVSQDHVYLDGFERDAVNFYPERALIILNRSRWRELRRATETKPRLRLVLHEYLWIAGVEDEGFRVSERLIEFLQIGNYSPNIWWNPVNPVNFVSAQLSFGAEGCTFSAGHFSVNESDERVALEPQGTCENIYRRVEIVKSAGMTPPSSNVRGLFHRFEISVFNQANEVIGNMIYEPEWGECLLPQEGACRVSGKLIVGGVELVLWFVRE